MTPHNRFLELCREYSVTPTVIRSPARSRYATRMRRVIARDMRIAGYSFPEIGRVMRRHHTTIIYMVDPEYRSRSNERANKWHADRAKQ